MVTPGSAPAGTEADAEARAVAGAEGRPVAGATAREVSGGVARAEARAVAGAEGRPVAGATAREVSGGVARAEARAVAGAALARRVAGAVPDPEMPMLTLADLGVLRSVEVDPDGTVTAVLTPTYSGCPALAEMRADVDRRLRAAGFAEVRIRTSLEPPWSTDWITPAGRRALADHGVAPPGPAPRRAAGPVPLLLSPRRPAVPCPRCGSADTEETSRFSGTACKALWRCRACREPFEYVKEI